MTHFVDRAPDAIDSAAGGGAWWRRPWLILLALALISAAIRLPTYHEPLERDLTTYAVIAREMILGKALYADLWDHKPPAIHVTYMLAQRLAGYGPGSIYLMNVLAAVATLGGVYAGGRALAGSARAGLWAAALWTAISITPAWQANQPNTEVFINACLVWVFALLARHGSTLLPWRTVLMVGLLTALASLYKHVAIVPVVLMAGAHVLCWPAEGAVSRWGRLFRLGAAMAVTPMAWLLTWAWFAMRGHGEAFVECVHTFNRIYAMPSRIDMGQMAGVAGWGLLATAPALAHMVLAGRRRVGGSPQAGLLLMAWAAGTGAAIALPGHFHPHYHQFWLPVLCLSLAAGWSSLRGWRWVASRRGPGVAAGLVVLAVAAPHGVMLATWDAEAWSTYKYDRHFVRCRDQALELRRLLEPGETMWNWGSESGLYFYSQKRPVTRLFYILPLVYAGSEASQRLALDMALEMGRDLAIARPDVVVMTVEDAQWLIDQRGAMRQHPVLGIVVRDYELFPDTPTRRHFALFCRKGSALQRRLAGGAAGSPGSPGEAVAR